VQYYPKVEFSEVITYDLDPKGKLLMRGNLGAVVPSGVKSENLSHEVSAFRTPIDPENPFPDMHQSEISATIVNSFLKNEVLTRNSWLGYVILAVLIILNSVTVRFLVRNYTTLFGIASYFLFGLQSILIGYIFYYSFDQFHVLITFSHGQLLLILGMVTAVIYELVKMSNQRSERKRSLAT